MVSTAFGAPGLTTAELVTEGDCTILAGREDVGTYTEVDGVIIFEVTCPGWISPDWKCCNSFRIDAGLAPVVEYVKR